VSVLETRELSTMRTLALVGAGITAMVIVGDAAVDSKFE
jgi:hypothetical protein